MKIIKLMLILIIMCVLLTSCKSKEEIDDKGINSKNQNVKDKETDEELRDNVENQENKQKENISQKIRAMSIDEKIGQLIISGFEGTEINSDVQKLISEYKIGGFILFSRNIKDTYQTRSLLNGLKNENSNNDHPLFLSIDEEGGRVSRLPKDYIKLPTAMDIGNKNKEEISYNLGQILGKRVKSLGFNVDFAPILDIYSNPKNTVIGDRAFGSTVQRVVDNGLNVIEGIRSVNIIPAAKHFPGHGDTLIDSHLSLPKVEKTLEELKSFELKPFNEAIKKDVEMIMIAHILYPNIDEKYPSSMSNKIIGEVLRKDLGYKGVVVSDDMTMGAIRENYSIEEASLEFLKAGGDIALVCHGIQNTISTINHIKKSVEVGELSVEQLDEKVYRVLKLKEKYKLEDEIIEEIDSEELNKETLDFIETVK